MLFWWRTRNPSVVVGASSALLYAALLTGWDWCTLAGALLSPWLWRPALVTRRHSALLAAALFVVGAGPLAVLDHWATLAQGSLLAVTLSPSFAYRPSGLALFGLVPTRDRRIFAAVVVNIGTAVLLLIGLQTLTIPRSDLETVGYIAFAAAAAVEAVNGWVLWRVGDDRVSAAYAASVLVVAALAIVSWTPSVTPRPASVAIWWPTETRAEYRTVAEGYGWNNIGTIGELPRLLERAGYSVTRTPQLERVDARLLILPVPFRRLTSDEIERVRQYVAGGGRLLLIGEHTNLDGVRDSFNALLFGSGIDLRFDTTNALFGDGTAALTGRYVSENPYLTHNRGASLNLLGVRPQRWLVGSWWHADLGDPLAPERGYLSDYRLSPGDAVGNLVLAAETRLGAGRIVVWGDGSPFLNQNLIYNSRYILDIVHDLTGDRRVSWIAPLVAGALVLAWLVSRRPEVVGIAAVLGALAAVWTPREAPLPQPLAVVSDAENNGFDRNPFSGRSVTGLSVWLTRAGYVPWLGDWRSLPEVPRLLFIVNPQRSISRQYIARVRRVAQAGATVVITGSGDEAPFRALARQFGCEPVGSSIGSVSGEAFTTYSAWRVNTTASRTLKAGEVPVGVVSDEGRGRIVIVADSGFFFSSNLETETAYDLKNQQFLTELLGAP